MNVSIDSFMQYLIDTETRLQTALLRNSTPMSLSKPQRLHKPRFKDWLMDVLDRNLSEDAKWCDQFNTIALIRWPHKSRGTWKLERDAKLFEMWAVRSGKYRRGHDSPNPKSWKCNFRMNLNICKNIIELRDRRVTKGPDACRFFQFLDKGQSWRAEFSPINTAPLSTEDSFINTFCRHPQHQFHANRRYPCSKIEQNLFPDQIGTTQFPVDGLSYPSFSPYLALPAPQNPCNPNVFPEQNDTVLDQINKCTTMELSQMADNFPCTESLEDFNQCM